MRSLLVFLGAFVFTLAACSACATVDKGPPDEMMVRPGGDVLPAKFLGGPPDRSILFVCGFVDTPPALECVSVKVYARIQAERREEEEASKRAKGEDL